LRAVAPLALALAIAALAGPAEAAPGEVRWYVHDDEDAQLWRTVVDAVWRGDPFSVHVWDGPWPPRPALAPAEVADTADAPWTCWLLEEQGESPRIVISIQGLSDLLHVPLRGETASHDVAVRTAVILTMSLRRTIGISDAGWLPAADLATLLGADVQPAAEEEPPPPLDEEEADDEPIVDEEPTTTAATVELGLGMGIALHPAEDTVAAAPSLRVTVRRGPWVGVGPLLSLEAGGIVTTEAREVGLTRVLVAGRWQFTPAAGRFSFPLGIGFGAAITRAVQRQPLEGEPNVGVPPVLCLDAGARVRLAPILTLAVRLDATVDLIPVRVVVEGGVGREEIDLGRFALAPRVEIVFHPAPR